MSLEQVDCLYRHSQGPIVNKIGAIVEEESLTADNLFSNLGILLPLGHASHGCTFRCSAVLQACSGALPYVA